MIVPSGIQKNVNTNRVVHNGKYFNFMDGIHPCHDDSMCVWTSTLGLYFNIGAKFNEPFATPVVVTLALPRHSRSSRVTYTQK